MRTPTDVVIGSSRISTISVAQPLRIQRNKEESLLRKRRVWFKSMKRSRKRSFILSGDGQLIVPGSGE